MGPIHRTRSARLIPKARRLMVTDEQEEFVEAFFTLLGLMALAACALGFCWLVANYLPAV